MNKWKAAGLFLLIGLQIQAAAMATDTTECLMAYSNAERDLALKIAEKSGQRNAKYLGVGGGTAIWIACAAKSGGFVGIAGCTIFSGMVGLSGYLYGDQAAQEIEKKQDAATIMNIYSEIKAGRWQSSDAVIGLMRDLRVDLQKEQSVIYAVLRTMENGELCDENNRPNKSFEEFQTLVKPE